MQTLALVLMKDPATELALKQVMEATQIQTVRATHPEEASALLERCLPHLLVVDLTPDESASPDGESAGLRWLKQIRASAFSFLPVVALNDSIAARDVELAGSLGVWDYIVKPADYTTLSRKFAKIRKTLRRRPVYATSAGMEGGTLRFQVTGSVRGVSETGLMIESDMLLPGPVPIQGYATELFDRIGVRRPRLQPMGCHVGTGDARCDFGIVGWTESERRALRRWASAKSLRPVRS